MELINNDINSAMEYLKKNAKSIIQELNINLVKDKPENISLYCKNWLNRNAKTHIEENMKNNKERPEGIESSNDEDEYYDETIELNIQNQKNKNKQRSSVSAEVYGKFNIKKNYIPKVIEKSETIKLTLKNLLNNSFMFKNLENSEKDILVSVMKNTTVKNQEQIIKQGDDGNELFIVEKGRLKCTKNDSHKILRFYEENEVFGELALLYNAPRAANIIAETDCILWSLDRETFNFIVKEAAIKRREKYNEFLNKVEILNTLEIYEKEKLCDCLEIENFKKDDFIIKQGDNGDKFYLVISGTADAFQYNMSLKNDEKVFEYKENMYFGELSLLRDCRRAASIRASSDLVVGSIDRMSFKRILGSLDNILERNVEMYEKFVKNN